MPTHQVTNQPPPLAGYDASADPALHEALRAFHPGSRPAADRAAAGGVGAAAGPDAPDTPETGSTKWSSTPPGTS
jgi:putative acyl-CoA dehydrogenase